MEYMVRDVAVYYETYGSGMPVLMIHGWSPDHRLMKGCMEPIFQSIDTPWQRIYFDLPGMGKTKGQPWITGTDQVLGIILDFIDAIIPDRHFVVAGESYGGYLARGIVRERPSLVDGLLMLCPLAACETQKSHAPVHQVLEKDEELLNSLSAEDRQFFEGVSVLQAKRVWDRFREEVLPGLRMADYSFLNKTLGKNVPYSSDVDRLEKPFTQPTLMIMGRQDSVVGYQDHWQFIENYPRASFVILDKAGHNLQIEQDELFEALVKEWLRRVASERR